MTSPKIMNKTFEDLLKENAKLANTMVPEWNLNPDNEMDPGACLIKLFTHMQEDIYSRLNRVPEKNLRAFLDMLGIKVQSSRLARVPVTFYPVSGFPDAIYIPEGTSLAAPLNESQEDVNFETEKSFSVCDNQITSIFSVNPKSDEVFDHLPSLLSNKPFQPFSGQNLQQHILYLGHSQLFKVEGCVSIKLRFKFQEPVSLVELKKLVWEHVDEAGKVVAIRDPKIECLDENKVAEITLTPLSKIKPTQINGKQSAWISSRPQSISDVILPAVREVKIVKISSRESGTKPDFAFCGFTPIDLTAEKIYPLGKEPKLYDSFYMSCREVLSKNDAKITITLSRSSSQPAVEGKEPSLLWEYLDGAAWKILQVTKSKDFDKEFKGTIEFNCPTDLHESEIHGIKNFWIRATLIAGDWGKEKLKKITVNNEEYWVVDKSDIKPPWLSSIQLNLNVSWEKGSALENCLAYNNLEFVDFTSRCRGEQKGDSGFRPFLPLSETRATLYLGFKNCFPVGNTSIFFSLDESSAPVKKRDVKWSIWAGPLSLKKKMEDRKRIQLSSIKGLSKGTGLLFNEPGGEVALENATVKEVLSDGIIELERPLDYLYSEAAAIFQESLPGYLDNTEGLIKSEILDFISLNTLAKVHRFGKDCCWLAGNLLAGEDLPLILGIYPNTIWSGQIKTVKNEVLGSSSGEKNMSFSFNQWPVVSSEVWVKEGIVLSESDRVHLTAQKIRFEDVTDSLGRVVDAWIEWKEVEDLYGCSPHDRNYLLDAASGTLIFGDGIAGMIPPIERENIKVNYKWGGGSRGNLLVGDVNQLKMPIAGIEKISNNIESVDGSDMECMSAFLERGPQQLRHRNRAVTLEDYARIAKASHSSIARIKCVAKDGKIQVTVIPNGPENRPTPTQKLLTSIKSALACKSQVSLPDETLQVLAPTYKEVKVAADVVAASIDLAVPLKRAVMDRLNAYLHPLTGGPRKDGWAFGRGVRISEIYSVIQGIDGVIHVENLTLNDKPDHVTIDDSEMVCSGIHVVTVKSEV